MNAGIEPGSGALLERAKSILLKPNEEWPKIAAEPQGTGDILRSYVLPLAAIGPVATLIGGQIFGYGAFGYTYKPSVVSALTSTVVSYALAIVAVFLLAFIANFLAPKFDGESNKVNAFKLVAYGATASWLSGVFSLIPALSVFGLLGLYSIYLFYAGAEPLMKVPKDKSVAYTAITIISAVILMLIISPITAAITGALGGGMGSIASERESGGTIGLPGGGSIEVGEVEKMAQRMEDAASGKTSAIEASKLQELLPSSIGSYERTATENLKLGAVGSTAEGTYSSEGNRFKLRVSDMSALGAIAGLGAAMGVEQSKEDADGYERTGTVDGEMQTEAWNNVTKRGKFGRIIADRFLVEAEGSADSIDALKAAVAEIDAGDLAELAGG